MRQIVISQLFGNLRDAFVAMQQKRFSAGDSHINEIGYRGDTEERFIDCVEFCSTKTNLGSHGLDGPVFVQLRHYDRTQICELTSEVTRNRGGYVV